MAFREKSRQEYEVLQDLDIYMINGEKWLGI